MSLRRDPNLSKRLTALHKAEAPRHPNIVATDERRAQRKKHPLDKIRSVRNAGLSLNDTEYQSIGRKFKTLQM